MRENFEVNKDNRETFAAVQEEPKEPLQAMYGNQNGGFGHQDRNSDGGRSRERCRGFQKDGNRKEGRDRKKSWDRKKS